MTLITIVVRYLGNKVDLKINFEKFTRNPRNYGRVLNSKKKRSGFSTKI